MTGVGASTATKSIAKQAIDVIDPMRTLRYTGLVANWIATTMFNCKNVRKKRMINEKFAFFVFACLFAFLKSQYNKISITRKTTDI